MFAPLDPAAVPLISVIVPLYNARRFIGDALASVYAQTALASGQVRLEVWVIDDGSIDDGPEWVATAFPEVRRLRSDDTGANRGPAVARNVGLRAATGEIIAFIDADDLWPADKLAVQLAAWRSAPTAAGVMGQTRWEWVVGCVPNRPLAPAPPLAHSCNLGACLFRAAALAAVGGFNETLRFGEDMGLFQQLRRHPLPLIPSEAVGLIYRLHENNMTRDRQSTLHGAVAALRAGLRRDSTP